MWARDGARLNRTRRAREESARSRGKEYAYDLRPARKRLRELLARTIDPRSDIAASTEVERLREVAEKLTSVPLTWHPRGEAEKRSFDATMDAYRKARQILGR